MTGYAAPVTAAPMTQLLGGRYALGPVMGRGGMAQVLRATDTVLGREVAVKLFHPHVEDVDRTSSEIALLASLNHPGLVSLYDAGATEDGAPFLVMELVDGPTLAACCLDGTLTQTRVAGIGADLAEALAHCHERGVIHRDVKPANVLLTADDRAKLTDFGIARLVDAARHTATGLTVGTAPYFSPEQVRGGAVGPPTDVYALGLVLLEALTGRREYADSDPVACAVERLHRDPVVPASLPAPWPSVLSRMTAADPSDRPTAADVAGILRGRAPVAATDVVAVPVEPPVDATRLLTVAQPTPAPGHDAAAAVVAAPHAPGDPREAVTTAVPAIPEPAAAPARSARSLPAWLVSARGHLVGDPAGQVLAAALLVLVVVLLAVAAFSAVGSGSADAPAADLSPVERLEESVRR